MALERLSLSVEMEGHWPCAKKQQNLVPGARIELATPAFSGRRSTTELPRHMWCRNCMGCGAIVSIRLKWMLTFAECPRSVADFAAVVGVRYKQHFLGSILKNTSLENVAVRMLENRGFPSIPAHS
jgi:hypothetical protein